MASIAPYNAARLHSDLVISSSIYGLVTRIESILVGAFNRVRQWQRRSATRRMLAALDDRMLSDIGINRYEIELEAEKPFWRR